MMLKSNEIMKHMEVWKATNMSRAGFMVIWILQLEQTFFRCF